MHLLSLSVYPTHFPTGWDNDLGAGQVTPGLLTSELLLGLLVPGFSEKSPDKARSHAEWGPLPKEAQPHRTGKSPSRALCVHTCV